MYMVSSWKSNHEWVKKKGQSSQETVTGKPATYTEEHPWSFSRASNRNLTENLPFCTWSSFPQSPEMDLRSALSWTQETCVSFPHFSLLQRLPAGRHWVKPAPLSLDAAPLSRKARALTALRRESSRQLVTEPSLKAKHPAPAGQRGLWRPLWAAREERAAPRSQSPEGSPRSSSAASAQTGSPNPNGAEQLRDPPQNMAKEQLEPVWNAAIKRNTFESVPMKWMNLERIKQGSQSEREKPGL